MIVRQMKAHDAPDVAALSEQLGYPITAEQIAAKFSTLNANTDHGFFVAEGENTVLGWVHVYGVHLLESDPFAEIGGLVVEERQRRQGVGRALMQQSEEWARAKGYYCVRLRSGLHRTEAYIFHRQVGYELIKTAHTFRKILS